MGETANGQMNDAAKGCFNREAAPQHSLGEALGINRKATSAEGAVQHPFSPIRPVAHSPFRPFAPGVLKESVWDLLTGWLGWCPGVFPGLHSDLRLASGSLNDLARSCPGSRLLRSYLLTAESLDI